MIKIKDFGIGFEGRELFSGLNLDLKRGDFLLVEGRSGSGKTSLLESLAGFRSAQRGTPHQGSVRREFKTCNWMPQRFVLPLTMTVEEYVQTAHLSQMPWWQSLWSAPDLAEQDLLEILLRLEISHLRYRKLSSLSGGERQRLAVVRAILSRQAVLILDEPSSMLDAQSSTLVLDLLCELAAKQNRLIICSSHDPQWLQCPHARKLSLGCEYVGGYRLW